MGNLVDIKTKPTSTAERATQTRLETMEITAARLDTWRPAPVQRPLKVNSKVLALAEEIKRDEVIPGVITLGVYERHIYVLDGQHRLHAFRLSGIALAYADVRIHHFDSIAAMGEEFVKLNSALVRLKPDDILRAMEESNPALALIRKRCPFVGFDMIRRGPKSPILSMSIALRAWNGSAMEVPAPAGGAAYHVATTLSLDDAEMMVGALEVLVGAWGRDEEYNRLWGALNLTLCLWLYRRTVITPYSPKTPKLSRAQFGKSMMALSASPDYLDWLVGRLLRDSDRSPAYSRIKQLVAKRMEQETGRKALLPQPAWAHGGGRRPA